jgi:UDP-N-acetylmuramoyl-L-alanyl-D-glutamate--2,6-diaminopimelate ligase
MQILIQWLKNQYHLLSALLACLVYRFPAKKLNVIGVTGTDGKTTTSTLIYHLLKHAGYKVALISTVAAYIGDKHIDTGFHVTSPNEWQLQKLIRQIADQGFTHLVLESTSHGLDQHRLLGANIKTAVITNVTHEHLDYHLTYDRYLAAKAKIMVSAQTVILNADDEQSYAKLTQKAPKTAKQIGYTLYKLTPELKPAIVSRFPQKYNQSNALAASHTALSLGVSLSQIIEALPLFAGIPGRMQYIENELEISIIVDFAHTPNALENALKAAKQATEGRLIAVFGSAGKRDKTKRPLMGAAADKYADEIILTAEDPRGEDVRLIINQIKSGILKNKGHVHGVTDRATAIAFAISLVDPGDTVIVCGKGHEQSMNLDGKNEIAWSDAAVIQNLISS